MSNRSDQYWPVSGFAGDSDDIQPRAWVALATLVILIVAGVYTFVLWRDEHAPVSVETRP